MNNDYTANVTVTMGGTDITSTAYSNGVISIASVTGNLVITVTETYTGNLFDVSTATDSARIKSSGATEVSASWAGQLVTDFIPASSTDVIHLVTDRSNGANTYTGMIALYNSSKTHFIQLGKGHAKWSWTDTGYTDGTFRISGVSGAENTAYIRICTAYTDASNISVTKS